MPLNKRGKHIAKKKRTEVREGQREAAAAEAGEGSAAPMPSTFVFRKGLVGRTVRALVGDLRRVMEPHTAARLRESPKNTIGEFVDAAVATGTTHLVALSTAADTGATFLRVGRVPRGPTVAFRVREFTLATEVARAAAAAGKARASGREFASAPLVVLSNFGAGGRELRLAGATLQNMFEPLNVETVRLAACRRVVLFHYDAERASVRFRHYLITAAPSGVNRNVRRVLQGAKGLVQSGALARAQDIADFVLGPAAASESEASEAEDCKIALPQDFAGPGNRAAANPSERSTVRLVELGPRMELSLFRIQDGLFDGKALFGHDTQQQKPRKKRHHQQQQGDGGDADMEAPDDEREERHEHGEGEDGEDEDDDTAWYRQEVGEEPEESVAAAAAAPAPAAPKHKHKHKHHASGPAGKKQKTA